MVLNYNEKLLMLVFAITECISFSAFALQVGIPTVPHVLQ